jgi:hypothetical protein
MALMIPERRKRGVYRSGTRSVSGPDTGYVTELSCRVRETAALPFYRSVTQVDCRSWPAEEKCVVDASNPESNDGWP